MNASLLADLTLVLHALFVAFVVFGLVLTVVGIFRGWRWVRRPVFRYAHLLAIGIVVVQAWLGIECPLTTLEGALRLRAGEAGYDTSFVQYWLYRLLYYRAESWMFTLLYSAFGAAVALVWWIAPPRRRQSGNNRLDLKT
ncbi:MAG: DUF2784 domain-containing protein [Gammaproteobacteria bacterium]